ncbi:MAG: hypothetical protein CTY25_08980 [Methylobacterium sp.]|nr:MAG: hypothetical protein CTY25_08980 [Methylobacterium sp.]
MIPESTCTGLPYILATSTLVQAQSLEILFERINFDIDSKDYMMRIGSLFEDIGNIYLNISERISAAYADAAMPNIVEFSSLPRVSGAKG